MNAEDAPADQQYGGRDLSNLKMERTHPEFGGCWLPNDCYSTEAPPAPCAVIELWIVPDGAFVARAIKSNDISPYIVMINIFYNRPFKY